MLQGGMRGEASGRFRGAGCYFWAERAWVKVLLFRQDALSPSPSVARAFASSQPPPRQHHGCVHRLPLDPSPLAVCRHRQRERGSERRSAVDAKRLTMGRCAQDPASPAVFTPLASSATTGGRTDGSVVNLGGPLRFEMASDARWGAPDGSRVPTGARPSPVQEAWRKGQGKRRKAWTHPGVCRLPGNGTFEGC